MKTFSLLLLLPFLLLGCKKAPSFALETVHFSEKDLDICHNDPCSQITINYPKISGEKSIATAINGQIHSYVIGALFLGEDPSPSANTIEAAAQQFIMAYRDHKNEFEFEAPYEASIQVLESFQGSQLLSLEMNSYLFTGGAHGYGSTQFSNFDKATGETIPKQLLFKDYDSFKPFAEKEFRKQFQIPLNESINSTGFWFEDDVFSLPETIGFTPKSLIFIYNPYDIASYAEGPIEVTIPLKDVQPFLNISLE